MDYIFGGNRNTGRAGQGRGAAVPTLTNLHQRAAEESAKALGQGLGYLNAGQALSSAASQSAAH